MSATGFDASPVDRAREALSRGALDEARAIAETVDAGSADYAAAQHLVSLVEQRAGRLQAAVDAASAAVQREPERFDFRMTLADAFAAMEAWEAAADTSAEALALNASSYDGWLAHGNHCIRCGRYEAAADAYHRARRLEPTRIEAPVNLASCLDRLGDIEGARESLLEALRIDPDNPGILLNLGRAYSNLGNQAEAIRTYEKALALDGRFVHAYVNLAVAHLLDRSPDAALEATNRCLAVSPAERGALALRLMALQQAGRMDEYRDAFAFDALLYTGKLAVPEGHASLDAFNAALAKAVLGHPTLVHEPTGKSTRRGKQTGNLGHDDGSVFAQLKDAIFRHFEAFLDRPAPDGHPYAVYEPHETSFYMWATVLEEQGHQSPHIHPAGWISGVYYVQVPHDDAEDADPEAGWIEFGEPDIEVPGIGPENTDLKRFAAREGELFLFPSYFFHRTIPYRGKRPRISIAFDLIPRSLRRRGSGRDLDAFARELEELARRGDARAAIARCHDALSRDSGHPEALRFLAVADARAGQPDAALDKLERAARVSPAWLPAQLDLVSLVRRMQGSAAALDMASMLLAANESARLRSLRADLAIDLGRFDAAHDDLVAVLEARPDDSDAALLFAKLPNADPDGTQARAIMTRAADVDRPALKFAAAGFHERRGEFSAAFTACASANRRLLARRGLSSADGRVDAGALVDTFGADFFSARPASDSHGEPVLLIVGLPRSGTTLVQQILAAHPQVQSFGETELLFRLVGQLSKRLPPGQALPHGLALVPAEAFAQAGRAYVDALAGGASPSAVRWIDRTAQNYTMLGLVQVMLPGARVVSVVRGRGDTVVSNFMHPGGAPYTRDLTAMNAACDDHDRLMAHWHATLSVPMLTVRYEVLVGEFERTARTLVEFAGLPWSDACLRYHDVETPVVSGDRFGVRQPVYTTSVQRWRRFADDIGALRDKFDEDKA